MAKQKTSTAPASRASDPRHTHHIKHTIGGPGCQVLLQLPLKPDEGDVELLSQTRGASGLTAQLLEIERRTVSDLEPNICIFVIKAI